MRLSIVPAHTQWARMRCGTCDEVQSISVPFVVEHGKNLGQIWCLSCLSRGVVSALLPCPERCFPERN